MSTITNETLEKEFQKTFSEIIKSTEDPENPPVEFQKLLEFWKKSRENESRLSQRCRELQTQLAANKARTLVAAAKTREDLATIASLKKEMENAWKMVDEAHEKEQKSRDTIQSLQQEVEQLGRIVEHSASLALTQERLAELQKSKDDLTTQNESLQTEIVELNDKLITVKKKIASQEDDISYLQTRLTEVSNNLQDKEIHLQREIRLREKGEIEFRQVRAEAYHKETTIQLLNKTIEEYENNVKNLRKHLEETKVTYEGLKLETDKLKTNNEKLEHETESMHCRLNKLNEENHRKTTDLKLKEDECIKLKNEILKLTKLRDSLYVKIHKLDEQIAMTTRQSELLKGSLHVLEKETDAAKKQTAQDEKVIDELLREKTTLNKNVLKMTSLTEKQSEIIKSYEQSKRVTDTTISQRKDEITKNQKLISDLVRERDRAQNENTDLKNKILRLSEDIKAKDMSLLDYQKRVADGDTKIKQQQCLYEAIKSDRNFYSKSLGETQDEVGDLKRKLKQAIHQAEHLKEDLTSKEHALFHEQHEKQKLQKEYETLKLEFQHAKNSVTEWRSRIEILESTERNLLKLIRENEEESRKQKQQIEKLINEKNALSTQNMDKNKEISSLEKTLQTLELSNSRKETEQSKLLDDIKLLKLEVKRLREENAIINNSVGTYEELQNKVCNLEKDLMREKLKTKALETELESPQNVHRWRRLAGSDPTMLELIQKTHILQKRLIIKSEEATEARNALDENERLKLELLNEDNRRQSSSMADKVLDLQQNLREKDKQLKTLTSERSAYLSKMKNYKEEIEVLKEELRDAKLKILLLRKDPLNEDASTAERKIARFATAQQQNRQNTRDANKSIVKVKSLGSGFRIKSASVSNIRSNISVD